MSERPLIIFALVSCVTESIIHECNYARWQLAIVLVLKPSKQKHNSSHSIYWRNFRSRLCDWYFWLPPFFFFHSVHFYHTSVLRFFCRDCLFRAGAFVSCYFFPTICHGNYGQIYRRENISKLKSGYLFNAIILIVRFCEPRYMWFKHVCRLLSGSFVFIIVFIFTFFLLFNFSDNFWAISLIKFLSIK